ncbi:MAG: DUF4058 family protein [Cyanothece sp. SIO1E1]|nr:DUF4058 family protein [Cyanothece sp. SIO1E1]
MPSPFPGMNPYLEQPELWPEVHKRLTLLIADVMNPQLRPKYRVAVEERVYQTSGEDSLLVGIPDDVVVQPSRSRNLTDSKVATATPSAKPITVTIPMPEEIREWYLAVRNVGTGEVITVIEILSPKNKRAGVGREKYTTKRQQILGSLTHLVEMDLLRQGNPMPFDGHLVQSHYRILVSRSDERPKADLYAFNIRDAIPSWPLPLKKGDTEPVIKLQELLHDAYERGSYDLVIDYGCEPTPTLSAADLAWMDGILRENTLR